MYCKKTFLSFERTLNLWASIPTFPKTKKSCTINELCFAFIASKVKPQYHFLLFFPTLEKSTPLAPCISFKSLSLCALFSATLMVEAVCCCRVGGGVLMEKGTPARRPPPFPFPLAALVPFAMVAFGGGGGGATVMPFARSRAIFSRSSFLRLALKTQRWNKWDEMACLSRF